MTMKLKKVLLPFIAGVLALSLAACGNDDKETTNEQQVDKDKIVAIVNEEELTGEEYNSALSSLQAQMQQMGQDPTNKEAAEQVKKQVLDMLVNQTLILQKAKEEEIKASESEIDEEYSAFEQQFGGEKEMKKALKEQNMDVKMLKEQIAESIVFGKYEEKVAPVEKASEEEVKEYYDKVVSESKEAGQELPALEEVSKEIQEIIEREQRQKLLAAHVEELKEDAKIELKL